MKRNLEQAVENRRTYYGIEKASPITSEEIIRIVEHSVKYVPSSFNSQSARVVVLLGDQHDRLWEIVRETLRDIVPKDSFPKTSEKIDSFKNGFGTVMFFEDQAIVEGLQEQFSLYKDHFPLWSLQSSGMLQYVVWTSLEDAGLGASLQHYNPLIDDKVKAEWKLPKSWRLNSQMPFGRPTANPGEKEFAPLEDRVKVFG